MKNVCMAKTHNLISGIYTYLTLIFSVEMRHQRETLNYNPIKHPFPGDFKSNFFFLHDTSKEVLNNYSESKNTIFLLLELTFSFLTYLTGYRFISLPSQLMQTRDRTGHPQQPHADIWPCPPFLIPMSLSVDIPPSVCSPLAGRCSGPAWTRKWMVENTASRGASTWK